MLNRTTSQPAALQPATFQQQILNFEHLYLIGLTGNIGCGKSTVVAMLARHGAHVLDADQVTRTVMAVGQPAYQRIVATFGDQILETRGGPINRPALGRIVFADRQALRQLEAIVHPATREQIMGWINEHNAAAAMAARREVAVVDAIRLIEAGYSAFCDAVWVVTCDEGEQLRRLVAQRGMAEADARQRIAAQPAQREKVAVADVIIDNSGTLEHTEQQVERAWQAVLAQV
jgi:dephospho-CoA kinase